VVDGCALPLTEPLNAANATPAIASQPATSAELDAAPAVESIVGMPPGTQVISE
jgi:phosphoribosylcarboxyaminoimidazole (NCAIR) mutase